MSGPAVVTGGTGWLGRALLEALSPRPVRALVRTDAEQAWLRQSHPAVTPVRGDLTDPASLAALFEGPVGTTVFHCAAVIHPRSVREFTEVNEQGTANLLEAARGRAGRFIYVSSTAAEVSDGPYGKSKRAAEARVSAVRDLPTVIVRAPWFYGPHQPARQSEFFRLIQQGRVPVVGSGENLRAMVFTKNLCQGLLLCEAQREANGIYGIADREPYTMRQIIDTIADVLETDFGLPVKRRVLRLPGAAAHIAHAADQLLERAGRYHAKIHVLAEMNQTIPCSIARAERELGYAPAVALRDGMRQSVASMLEEAR